MVAAGTQLSVLPEEVIKAAGVAIGVLDEKPRKREVKQIPRELAPVRADRTDEFYETDTRAELAVFQTDSNSREPRLTPDRYRELHHLALELDLGELDGSISSGVQGVISETAGGLRARHRWLADDLHDGVAQGREDGGTARRRASSRWSGLSSK